MSTASPNRSVAKPARLVTSVPKTGATNGASWKLQVPVWIVSIFAHTALLSVFLVLVWVLGLMNQVRAGGSLEALKPTEKPIDTAVEAKEPDLTNTETGTESELPIQFNVPREAEVSVPGEVNPDEAIGVPGAPEGPQRTLSAPPGVGNTGSGLAAPGDEGGTGSMIGAPGGYASGIFNAGGFGGRSGATREKLLQEGGGNALSEAAVARGLEFLVRHQAPDGHWSMTEFHQHGRDAAWPNGRQIGNCGCKADGGASGNDIAGTAFGLLPLLGAGQTQRPSKEKTQYDYSKNVGAGLAYLIKKQDKEGNFGGGMYSHGLATIAMCEAFGLTNDPNLKVAAQRAVNYIVEAQDPKGGGWRYTPKTSGDMSVSGWQLMALKSAQMSGLSVPKQTLDNAEKFWVSLEVREAPAEGESSIMKKKGKLLGFSYTASGGRSQTPAMTAVGLLGLQYMGTTPANRDLIDGVEYLKKSPPGRMTHNMPYYEYYATQVMHHMGGESWKFWNLGPDGTGQGGIRDTLIAKQDMGRDPKHAHQIGSWDGTGVTGGGRLMATSLNLLSLEVYYRHLPLYRRELSTVKDKE
jgi:hypothetical protein